jgi:hypothetical protein
MHPQAEAASGAQTAEFRIGAIHGAATADIQKLLARFAERRMQEGLRVAGVIEEPAGGVDCGVCDSLVLRDTAGSTIIPITQNLGSGSSACKLDSAGLAAGCQAVVAAIEGGANVVVLSKYGKVEAEGGGLLDAFRRGRRAARCVPRGGGCGAALPYGGQALLRRVFPGIRRRLFAVDRGE